MKFAKPPIAVVSQWLVRTHGQGRINLEILRTLCRNGRDVTALATELEADSGAAWRRVEVPRRLPTNWAREQVFRRRGGREVERWRREAGTNGVVISNGAAVPQAGDLNLAMFVHAAWLRSPWHPKHTGGWHGRYLALYNTANVAAERAAFCEARRVIALSDVVRDELVEHVGVDAAQIDVIPPGVDAEEFRPAQTPEESRRLRDLCGIGEGPMLLLFAGEIRSPRKNLDLVLKALAALPGPHLAVAGDTAGSPYPRMAQELGVAERVHFLGQRNDLPALLLGGDAFIFPSHYEPFGLVVTEAMASGLPVVVTRQTGAASFVNAEAGLVLDDGGQLEPLVETLRRWDSNPDIRKAAGVAARQAAVAWSWSAMGERYVELIDALAGQQKAAA